MRQVEIENQLREVVGRLITEVDLATDQGRLDVNLISEDAWIPILKEVYHCPNLINLNRKYKNFPGIDLGDEQDRVAFQVTASTDIEKIKGTLEQFKKRSYKNSFDELYVFTIRKKQKSYSQDVVNKIIDGNITFNVSKHIIDPGDILSAITRLRLPAQERMLHEFRIILGDVKSKIDLLKSSENVPYLLTSNILKIHVPDTIYVAELNINKDATIALAQRDYGLKKKSIEKVLLTKLALRIAGLDIDGWVVHENQIFSFYNLEDETKFHSVIDASTVEELGVNDLACHSLAEYQNLFKFLLKDTLKDQFEKHNIGWSKQQLQFYFLPIEYGGDFRKVSWIGKRTATRTVYEKKYQSKDPSKTAYHRHLSFGLSFVEIDSEWFAIVSPNWFFTWNLYRKSRYHDELLSRQKRLEHNHSVRNLVRFIAYFLADSANHKDKIKFGVLEEFQFFSQISLEEDEQLAHDADEDYEDANENI